MHNGIGSRQKKVSISSAAQGRLQTYNVPRFHHFHPRILPVSGSLLTLFAILCVELYVAKYKKCTAEVGAKQIGDQTWDVALLELKNS